MLAELTWLVALIGQLSRGAQRDCDYGALAGSPR